MALRAALTMRRLQALRTAGKSQWRSFSDKPTMRRMPSGMKRVSSLQLEKETTNDPKQLAQSLTALQVEATNERIPWFQEQMPSSYFRHVSREEMLRHLVSVAAIPDMDDVPEVVSYEYDDNKNLTSISIISSAKDASCNVAKHIAKVPDEARLQAMNLYTSKDNLLTITQFIMSTSKEDVEKRQESGVAMLPDNLITYLDDLHAGKFNQDRDQYFKNTGEVLHAGTQHVSKESVVAFAELATHPGFEARASPRRFCKFTEMYHTLLKKGTDEVLVDVESYLDGNANLSMYTLALTNSLMKPVITRLSQYIESKNMDIIRVHLDRVTQNLVKEDSANDPEYNDVAFLRLMVHHKDEPTEDLTNEMKASLGLVAKWYDDQVLEHYYKALKYPFADKMKITLQDLEVLTGLLDCVHLVCSGTQMYEFSKPNIYSVVQRPQAFMIVDLFKKRFDPFNKHPEQTDSVFKEKVAEIKKNYNEYIEVSLERKVLNKMLDIVEGTQNTNLFNSDRFAFGLKLDPTVCMDPLDELRKETPYGVFYVNGRRFRGLQLRFREIARGGLRLVTPNSSQNMTIEGTRQFGECYDLAFAQQLKNKDIAEGGSKAVALIDLADTLEDNGSVVQERSHILRKCVKAFVNTMLDMITINEANNQEELIFLGPDEQISIEHINWIIRRAEERNYRMPSTFMSSKPDLGFNHKEFGVTSEGVQVFLDSALRNLNMLDKEYFTVKITGGPDGDVAGNMINILNREYGNKCRVVAMADGTGCVEDEENGINMEELLRLFKEGKPLSEINKEKLGPSTLVYTVDNADGVRKRNTMHNRVKADAFVPAGGRPATVNETNWEQFLDSNGTPTSKLIVEGANLFFTNFARKKLGQKGCVVVKDSSANKCGVICSSFEIISSMLLEQQEFLDIKPELVTQVVAKLRNIARKEADLLMTEYRRNTVVDATETDFNLVDVSIAISHAIHRATDSVREALERKGDLSEYHPLVKQFLPEKLVAHAWPSFTDKVPEVYTLNLVSTILACEMVYNEGVDFIDAIKDDKVLAETTMKYVSQKALVSSLVERLRKEETLSVEERIAVAKLLEVGGPRAALTSGLSM